MVDSIYHGPMKPPPVPIHSDGKAWDRWQAESNPTVLRALGKLSEESGELNGIIGRSIAQGLAGFAPTREQDPRYNGESNILALSWEIADTVAWANYCIDRLGLDREFIAERVKRKYGKAVWWLGAKGDPM